MFKGLGSVRCFMFFKDILYAQGYIYLIKNTEKKMCEKLLQFKLTMLMYL